MAEGVGKPSGSLSELREALDAGAVSARELVDDALARAEIANASFQIFLGLRTEAARREAESADRRRANGQLRSALDGIPIALKDNLLHEGEPTTCASKILEGFVAPYTGTVVQRLLDAGAIPIGRTNMDEFAMGSSTENSSAGPTRNPWDATRIPGGSSGGSAAAVAAGVVPIAIGSDTGGSIRQPAAHTGVVGLKPTYGRVSRYGLVAFASSLDQIGPLARTAADCAATLEIIAGYDPRDATSIPDAASGGKQFCAGLNANVQGLTIGLPREYFIEEGIDPEVLTCVKEAAATLEAAGATLREISLPHTKYAVATYYLIATAEASANLARYDGVRYGWRCDHPKGLLEMYRQTREEGFGAEVKRRILLGTYVLSAGYYDAYYAKACKVRTLLRRDFEAAFRECDVMLTPTSPEVAFKLGEKTEDVLSMYLSDVFTVSANLAGIPGISLPCGLAHDLPVGLQLLASPLDEARLLRVADAYQQRTPWHTLRPGDQK